MAREVVVFVRCDMCDARVPLEEAKVDLRLMYGDIDRTFDACKQCEATIESAVDNFLELGVPTEEFGRQQQRNGGGGPKGRPSLGEKAPCPTCHRKIAKKNLERHIVQQHGDGEGQRSNQVQCPHCPNSYGAGSGIALHIKAKHPEQRPATVADL